MWTRSAQNKETGLFAVECHDWKGNLFFADKFASAQEADRAGEAAERRMTMEMQFGKIESSVEMSDDELLAELGL